MANKNEKVEEVKEETPETETSDEIDEKTAVDEEKIKKKKKKHDKVKKLWAEFKKFINRGNVVDMAIGVVIGGAFNAIVKSLTNILLSLATWGVPGGLSGLVTVLPPLNEAQKAPGVYQNFYSLDEFLTVSQEMGPTLSKMYIQHGNYFYYKSCALIDWGAFINAIISFIIIALTLFVILKVYRSLRARSEVIKAKALEEYYEKHPELRPEPQDPKAPEPTEKDVLIEIRNMMRKSDPDYQKALEEKESIEENNDKKE